ncbi:hypothetical protein EGW08_004351 [Elysia chlorotica]|uniref:Apple domain-containing protein n=1 Tax=Elysia chlorotica TaxID=188477 RepID=A0A3S1BNP3_ELYCH|nr:hypothetical protein EGW08_004351 [Elysia chlorotica]
MTRKEKTKKMTFGIALVLTILFIEGGKAQKPYCKPKIGPSAKEMPKLDFPAFTSEYRAIIQDKSYTTWAKESYDSVNNKARIDMVKNGLETSVITDFYDNTYILFEYLDKEKRNFRCSVQFLSTVRSDNFNILGFKMEPSDGSKSIPHVLSSSNILQAVSNQEYIGETDIDGLPVDHFQSCVSWNDVNATFVLDYFFTTSDFQPRDALTPSQVPVRAEVQGSMEKGGQTVKFHHVYEYLDFRVFPELPAETFSLPEFMKCDGVSTRWQKQFPILPESMSYTVEKVTHPKTGDVQVELATVHIDSTWRLIRVDQGRSTSICDFSTGVEHVIDDNGCKERAIDPNNVAWAKMANGFVQMKARQELSYLQKNFFYTGVKKFRGISTNSFAADTSGELIEAYISLDGVTPLGVNVTNAARDVFTVYNIFNFDSTPKRSAESPFDIQRCRGSDESTDYSMTLIADTFSDSYLQSDPSLLDSIGDTLRHTAATLAGVSPLQIISIDVSVFDKNIYWVYRVLESQNTAQAYVQNQLELKYMSSIQMSLYFALYEGKFVASVPLKHYYDARMIITGLDFYDLADTFYLSVQSDILYNFENIYDKCVLEFGDEAQMLTTHSVHECAQACADTKGVACTLFEYVALAKACHLSWSNEEPALTNGGGCSLYRSSYLGYFSSSFDLLLKADDAVTLDAVDSEACAKLCFEEKSFYCESFDYCESEQQCQIYKTHLYSKDAKPVKANDDDSGYWSDCTHYSRRSGDFKIFYQSDFESPNPLQVMAQSYDECSYLCTKDEDGCLAYSFYQEDYTEPGTCKLLPQSQVNQVTFKVVESYCILGVSSSLKAIRRDGAGAMEPGNISRLVSGGFSDDGGYGPGAMFGLAVAMLAVGLAVTGLVVFALLKFNIWGGF